MNLVIGSGDIGTFLSAKTTKGFAKLLQKFVADDRPYYNAYASPIDALRTGAILEVRYFQILSDDYYIQYKSTSEDFNCLTSSIDFAKIDKGEIVDFDELKTINFATYLDVILPMENLAAHDLVAKLKSKFKINYNQVQFQLYCSGLDSANLVFLSVDSYDDEINMRRDIQENDFIKFRIERDEMVIAKIMERATIFQHIKDSII